MRAIVLVGEKSTEHEVDMFHLIWIMMIGLIVGALAKLLMPGRDPGGIFVTMLLGIAGSLVGGVIGRLLGLYGPNQGAGFIVSTLGAILLLWLYRIFLTHRHPPVGVHR
jgi:uncharacterized membrane protein YeaQ/YmgE (transglycosylase-associated protein family)